MIYMICYDITNPKRLRKTAKVLQNYGIRIQKSFFQCEIFRDMLNKLLKDILAVVDVSMDKLYVYPLCNGCLKNVKFDGT
ncbi:MAG: CRISPR-associated endonuclease Cas2 [bacterium]